MPKIFIRLNPDFPSSTTVLKVLIENDIFLTPLISIRKIRRKFFFLENFNQQVLSSQKTLRNISYVYKNKHKNGLRKEGKGISTFIMMPKSGFLDLWYVRKLKVVCQNNNSCAVKPLREANIKVLKEIARNWSKRKNVLQ